MKLLTHRAFTNMVHFVLDQLVPPIIRDSKWFMYPFFYLAYKGKNTQKYMAFKSGYYALSPEQLEAWYHNYHSIGTERPTDLNKSSLKFIVSNIEPDCASLLDAACGRGYFLNHVQNDGISLTGIDLLDDVQLDNAQYVKANIEALPFLEKSFDVVVSSHTLEHVLDIKKAVSELKRVAGKKIIVTVPRQRFNYYTLDLHLHFFPRKEMLINLMGIEKYECQSKGGDWVYVGYM